MKSFFYSLIVSLALPYLTMAGGGTTIVTPTTTSVTETYQGEPPTDVPVFSKAALKVWAMSQVTIGSVNSWSEGYLSSTMSTQGYTVLGSDADDVLYKLADPNNEIRAITYDRTKRVYVWSELRNSDGDSLFVSSFMEASKSETPTQVFIQGNLSLKMARYIPIRFPNAVSAYIRHVDSTGQEWTQEVKVIDGKLYYPIDYAGTQGTLIVQTYYPRGGPAISPGDSWQTAYNIGTGSKIQNTAVSGNIRSTIENHLNASDSGLASGQVLVASGVMTPPVDPKINPWESVAPPSVSFKLQNTAAGTRRTCIMSVTIHPTFDLGTVQAWAHDPKRIGSDGAVTEIAGIVRVTNQPNGDVLIISTWILDNDTDRPGGCKWFGYLIIGGYEIQIPAQQPGDRG